MLLRSLSPTIFPNWAINLSLHKYPSNPAKQHQHRLVLVLELELHLELHLQLTTTITSTNNNNNTTNLPNTPTRRTHSINRILFNNNNLLIHLPILLLRRVLLHPLRTGPCMHQTLPDPTTLLILARQPQLPTTRLRNPK